MASPRKRLHAQKREEKKDKDVSENLLPKVRHGARSGSRQQALWGAAWKWQSTDRQHGNQTGKHTAIQRNTCAIQSGVTHNGGRVRRHTLMYRGSARTQQLGCLSQLCVVGCSCDSHRSSPTTNNVPGDGAIPAAARTRLRPCSGSCHGHKGGCFQVNTDSKIASVSAPFPSHQHCLQSPPATRCPCHHHATYTGKAICCRWPHTVLPGHALVVVCV